MVREYDKSESCPYDKDYTLTELLRELELLRGCVFNFVAGAEMSNGAAGISV